MTTYSFTTLIADQHLAFDPGVDTLQFDSNIMDAAAVRLAISGSNLSFSYGKKVWLDNMKIGQLSFDNIRFANGGILALGDGSTDILADWYGQAYDLKTSTVGNQVWGLGGADVIETGSGADWLVGNEALTALNHVSRDGATGAPTATHFASISADGRFVAFEGGWTGFGSANNNATDVLVKDMISGSVSNEHKSASGAYGGSGSGAAVISADGQKLAFLSASANLVDGPASGGLYDIYMSDVPGNRIMRVSTGSGGELAANGRSLNPDLSADGGYVAFESDTRNWAATAYNTTYDIFVKDLDTGALTRVSSSIDGGDGNGDSRYAKISADGRFVVFESDASNLTAEDTIGYSDIFVWDRNDGSLTNLTAGLAVVSNPNNGSFRPDVAFDNGWGGVIVFETGKNLLPEDTSNFTDIYAYNFSSDTPTLQLVSSRADGTSAGGYNTDASVSGDGRFVVFSSSSGTLVANDTNGVGDVFVKDLYTGAIALVSRTASGALANQASGRAQISLGGDWIVFESSASNLATTDGNGGGSDVFRVSNPLLKDILSGGAGNDTYEINRQDTIIEAAGGGTDTVRSTISYALAANLENLMLLGSGNLSGTGNVLNNLIYANTGNNLINGGGGIDTVSYANGSNSGVTVNLANTAAQSTGGSGVDTLLNIENLTGSNYNDNLTGNAANNRLDGGLGNDLLAGGAGNDIYVVNSIYDNINSVGESGIDAVYSSVSWTLQSFLENLTLTGVNAINGGGNQANNVITGNSAANSLNGYGGNDTLNGGAGNDTLAGSIGNDTYVTDSSGDVIVESGTSTTEIDTVISSVNWTLGARLENLTLSGSAAINGSGNGLRNIITGNGAANTLNGYGGNDTLKGGGGNDILKGGSGLDTLVGGTGNDRFDFDSLAELGLGTLARDVITDFTRGQDKIDLSTIDAIAALGGDQAFVFRGTAGFTGVGQVSYSGGIVAINTDADTAAEYEIQLTGIVPTSLAATDFIL